MEVTGHTNFDLYIKRADVATAGNYTCIPFNQVGTAEPAAVNIRIFAPPNFVEPLKPFTGRNLVNIHFKSSINF